MGYLVAILMFTVAVLAVARYGRRFRKSEQKAVRTHLAGDDEFAFDIVGESRYQAALRSIAGDGGQRGVRHACIAELVLEDSNQYDSRAVRVDIDGKTVGYMSKFLAREYRSVLPKLGLSAITHTCAALIVAGWSRPDGTGSYGVKLDLRLA